MQAGNAAEVSALQSGMAKRRKARTKKAQSRKQRTGKRWSQRVTQESDALTLEHGVFTKPTPRQIALSLKRSADRSRRRKSDPYRSAMSMLTFYINRGGKGLSARRKATLEKAKDVLRDLYDRN